MSTDTITLLQAGEGWTTAKTIGRRQDGSLGAVRDYDGVTLWEVVTIDVTSIQDLADVLTAASDPDYRMIVIRGEPREGILSNGAQKFERQNKNFDERPRRWLCCDFDKVVIDGADLARDPEGAICEVIRRHLPAYFHDVTCFWQLSSSAGLSPGLVKVHLWFWLNRPLGGTEGKAWAKIHAPDIDRALFQRVLPHYISAPKFVGVTDPLPRRTGLLEAERDVVEFPYLPLSTARPADSYEKSVTTTTDTGQRALVKLCEKIIELEVGERPPEIFRICCNIGRFIADGEISPKDAEEVVTLAIGGDPLEDRHMRAMKNGLQRGYADQAFPPKTPQSALSREAFDDYAKSLAKNRDDRKAEAGKQLKKISLGEALSDKSTYERLLKLLAVRFIDYTPESIAECFRQSLTLAAKKDPDWTMTEEKAVHEVGQQQEEIHAKQYTEEQQKKRERNTRMAETDRVDPYTAEELESFGNMMFKWIIQKGTAYYIFFEGAYVGPFNEKDARGACATWLAPARSADVELFKITKQGEVIAKPVNQLILDYGTVADKIEIDLTAQRSYWDGDPKRRTLVEAPCPLRDIKPVFHEEVADWLWLFAGDKHDVLLDWLSVVTKLDKPCRALLVTGPKGAGKTLLAHGVARLWTTEAPTTLDEVFADFNGKLLDCPLTFADEQMPKTWNGKAKNSELRLHIQALSRPLKRKYLPTVELKGATRTIVAANNEAILATTEVLSADDVEAIAARYLHVPVSQEATDYLRDTDTSEWVLGDHIAEHVAWLIENHKLTTNDKRFLVGGEDPTLVHKLANRTGVRSALCQWLVGFVLNPKPFVASAGWEVTHEDKTKEGLVVIRNEKLLVNAQGVLRGWDHYVGNEDCRTVGELNTALAGLSTGRTKPRGGTINYRVIDVEALIAWAEETGFSDKEAITNALKKETPIEIVDPPEKRPN